MRRTVLGLTGLVAGTTLLISLKSAPGATRTPEQIAADNAAIAALEERLRASATPTPEVTAASRPTPTALPLPAALPGPSQSNPPTPRPPTPRPPTTPPRTTRPPAPPPPGSTLILGDGVFTEFGYVTVGIEVSGGRITRVVADELPGDEARSIQLSERAKPVLEQRALQAQGTDFAVFSGATWTSDAFKDSLRSAMDKAGL